MSLIVLLLLCGGTSAGMNKFEVAPFPSMTTGRIGPPHFSEGRLWARLHTLGSAAEDALQSASARPQDEGPWTLP